ncbi:hypothetical protein ABI59_03765 [Acidobacteria bacterium Mor1]|nr:hypothetical protein ABI59_03765 [Acidobacteria bacterium Mor1]
MRLIRAALLLTCLLLLPFGGCHDPAPAGAVILITMDTTRADRLGCYGYDKAETPSIDALAAEGTLFEQAQSPISTTLASHSSMFTGNYPPVHGVRYNGMFTLGEDSVTVAEMLSEAGFRTGGFPAAPPLAPPTGVGQGFEEYELPPKPDDKEVRGGGQGHQGDHDHGYARLAVDSTKTALDFVRRHKGEPFFLWIHYWDPHAPWEPPFPYSSRFAGRPYDGELAYADAELGKLFDQLKAEGAWDDTLIVLAGDHGEGLYEHGERWHAHLAYQTTLHVPLIVKAPGGVGAGRRVPEPVSLVDVGPTILDYAGMAMPGEIDGYSLRPVVEGADPVRRALYLEAISGALVFGWSPLEGLRLDNWKLIDSGQPELYDLATDPGELNNLYDQEIERAEELRAELTKMRADWDSSASAKASVDTPISQEQLDYLASLGYLGGATATTELDRENAPQPREMLHLEPGIFEGREQAEAGYHELAIATYERVLAVDPDNRLVLHMVAMSQSKLGRLDDTLRNTLKMVELYPDYTPSRVLAGQTLLRMERFDEAAELYRKGIEEQQKLLGVADEGLTYRLAAVLFGGGKTEEALAVAEQAVGHGTSDPGFLVLIAAAQARLGLEQEALQNLTGAIAQGYVSRQVLEQEESLAELRALPGFSEVIKDLPPIPAEPAASESAGS